MKRTFITANVIMMLCLAALTAHAESNWYKCTAHKTGHIQDSIVVQLSCVPSPDTGAYLPFDNKWFNPRSGLETETLAMALLAISEGRYLRVFVDPGVSFRPELQRMYVLEDLF